MIHPIIKASLDKSISYKAYRYLVDQLFEAHDTSGPNKTEALISYTKLNAQRMKRWDKTLTISDTIKHVISTLDKSVTWLVITESWCGDAAHVLPVVNKLAECNANISLRIVFRDENPELMDMFLTNGARSIAKLIMIDNRTGEVIGTFGPRPSMATAMVNDYKLKHGTLTPEFKESLQQWYNKDKGAHIMTDIVGLISPAQPKTCL